MGIKGASFVPVPFGDEELQVESYGNSDLDGGPCNHDKSFF